VDEPEVLAWTEVDTGARVRTEFIELEPERTEIRIHQTRVPDAFMATEAQAGFKSSLDRFAAHLGRLQHEKDESNEGLSRGGPS